VNSEDSLSAALSELEQTLDEDGVVDVDRVARQYELSVEVVEDSLAGLRALEGFCLEEEPLPSSVAGYSIVRELGRGGMGRVFEGIGSSGERAAVKVLLNRESSTRDRRFEREAELMGRLEHPNLLRLLAFGHDAGRAYLITPICDSGSLADRLDSCGSIPESEVLEIGLAIAEGLAHAHAAGILHRDIKPSNVLFGEDGTPKLADFGLAQDLGRATRLTAWGQFLGTVGYVSPEQASGLLDSIDERSDVYSLGASLHEMATGLSPFDAHLQTHSETITKVDPALILSFLQKPPAPPSQCCSSEFPKLDPICLRSLEQDPSQRYQSADALADALAAALGRSRPRRMAVTEARPSTALAAVLSRVRRWIRERSA